MKAATGTLVEVTELQVGDVIYGNSSRRFQDLSTVAAVSVKGDDVSVTIDTKTNGRHRVCWNRYVELLVIR